MQRKIPGYRPLTLLCALLALLCATSTYGQSFPQPTVIPTGNWPAAIYTADLNGDGFPDLIYIDQGATTVRAMGHILLGDGHGGFAGNSTFGAFSSSLAPLQTFSAEGRRKSRMSWQLLILPARFSVPALTHFKLRCGS